MLRPTLLALIAATTPALADPLPPGLESARLLPGWTDADGSRIAALELVLEPGWKTYWRSPGDSGIPPMFDWSASRNLDHVKISWPTPDVIDSGGARSIGYHDRLILPLRATPATLGQPVDLSATVELGLCLNICVPANIHVAAGAAGTAPDPAIETALAQVPETLDQQPGCAIAPIADGMQLRVDLPQPAPPVVVMELDGAPDIWVSAAEIAGDSAVADFVPPAAAPFDLDPARVVITLIGPDGATEMRGCRPQG